MNLLIPAKATNPPTTLGKSAWGVAAVLLLAFAAFEMTKHVGWALGLGFLGLIGPDIALLIGLRDDTERGQLSRKAVPFYNLLHFWPLPLFVILLFTALPGTNDDIAPGFTLGLTWLAHICVDRALGLGLRNRAGWQRYRVSSNA